MKESRVAGRCAVHVPGHPGANSTGYVLKSRWIVEQKLGRLLREDEEVHHKDEDEQNDDPANLEVKTLSAHAKHHWPSKAHKMNGPANRRLDYALIAQLMASGIGYRRIAKQLNEPVQSVKYAVKVILSGR
jgi:hypothetical protein